MVVCDVKNNYEKLIKIHVCMQILYIYNNIYTSQYHTCPSKLILMYIAYVSHVCTQTLSQTHPHINQCKTYIKCICVVRVHTYNIHK